MGKGIPHPSVPLLHGPHQSIQLSGLCSFDSCTEIIRHPQQTINLVGELYTDTKCCVRTAEGTSEAFEVKTRVRQECILSPLLFNCFLDQIVNYVSAWRRVACRVFHRRRAVAVLLRQDFCLSPHSRYYVLMQMTWLLLQSPGVKCGTW